MKIPFTYENESGVEIEVEIPATFEVCGRCEGHGTHLTPSMSGHVYTPADLMECFDEEERREYFKPGGRYDVTCHGCGGNRVVAVPDFNAPGWPEHDMPGVDMREFYVERQRLRDHWDREDAKTRRMENGGFDE
jgi:hypothetical protein